VTKDENITLARIAYAAYGQTTSYKNYQGKPMPNWDDLGEPIQRAWIAAADAVCEYLGDPDTTD
jgi:uncharacterized protein YecT (DUF1311 family)